MIFNIDSGNHLFVSFQMKDGSCGEASEFSQNGFDIKAGGAYFSLDGKYLFINLNVDLYWVSIKIMENIKPNE